MALCRSPAPGDCSERLDALLYTCQAARIVYSCVTSYCALPGYDYRNRHRRKGKAVEEEDEKPLTKSVYNPSCGLFSFTLRSFQTARNMLAATDTMMFSPASFAVDPAFANMLPMTGKDDDVLIEEFFNDDAFSVFANDAPSLLLPDVAPGIVPSNPSANFWTGTTESTDNHGAPDASTADDYVPSEPSDDEEEEEEDVGPPKKKATRARRGTRTPEQRAQAVLEKNRRAQKRFRERSKQRAKDMEDTLKSLTDQVAKLTTANSSMATRTAMLEKVVTLRDEQIQQLQQEQKIFAFNNTTAAQLSLCDGASRCMPKELQLLPSGTNNPSRTPRPYEDVYAEFKSIVADMIPLLAEHDLASDDSARRAAASRLQVLAADMGSLCMSEAMRNPANIARLMAEDGSKNGAGLRNEDGTFWPKLVASLELSSQQVEEIRRLRSVFVAKQEVLIKERGQLGEAMRAATGEDLQGSGLRKLACDVVRMHQVSEALAANLSQQHAASMDFAGIMLKKTLKPMALARVLTACYPAFPDALRLATEIGLL